MTRNLDSQKLYEKWERKVTQDTEAKMCNENIVINQTEKKAKCDDWETIYKNDIPGQTGIDLKLKKGNSIIVIEAKGGRVSQKNAKSRIEMALGAIIMDMEKENSDKSYYYCLAFPATEAFKKCEIPSRARQQLGLNIIFVDCSTGLLKIIRSDRKDMTDFSSFDELLHIN